MGFHSYLLVIWSVITTWTVINASENIAISKATNQSSVYRGWDSSKAVDGCTSTDINSNCCTHTAHGQKEAWWQVDLQTQSAIETVNIIYRDESTLNRLAGYEIYLSNTSDWTSGTRCHKDTTADLASLSAIQNVPCPGVARYLTIYNDRRVKDKSWYSDDAYLELCEVDVYGCQVGKYGSGNCNNYCLNCLGNLCDPTSGACDICAAGYHAIGRSCVPCPVNCVGSKCDIITGTCSDGCITGFSGAWCRCPVNCKDVSCHNDRCTECNDGYYGPACTPCPNGCSTDTCDKTSGHCVQCVDGLHGSFCNQPCPAHCKQNVCTKDNGHCIDCDIGFYSNFCNLSCPVNCENNVCTKDSGHCTVCKAGFHGDQCFKSCGNCQGESCDKETGECTTGCTDGWTGDTCDTKVIILMDKDAAVRIGVGLGVGLGTVILALVIVIIVQTRRQTMKRDDTTNSTHMTDISSSRTAKELNKDQGDNYDEIVAHRDQSIAQDSPTDGNYEKLGQQTVDRNN